MNEDAGIQLGRRERQIVEILYRLGKASVAEVRASLPDPPTYSAVRGMLSLLEEKGHVTHQRDGMRYVYAPVIAPVKARQSALRHLVSTFFDGSAKAAAAALLDPKSSKLSAEDLNELEDMIRSARKEKAR